MAGALPHSHRHTITPTVPAVPALPAARVRALRRRLLRWYDRHHRDLPWRAAPGSASAADAYHVLVSEAMLQQTQVATVVPYFERFIARLPTLADLAAADEQTVLTLWQGLGYYRRARHLHAAARHIVAQHGGRVPADVDALLALPGVGRYVAGAIASIAFNRAVPILDGNVARVLARWHAIDEPIDTPATRDRLWAQADALVPRGPRGRAGDTNQALMELGALVCTPRSPRCDACPVRTMCRAAAAGRVDALPVRSPRKTPRPVTHHVAAIARRGAYLFEQRDGEGLWAGMWQLPTHETLSAAAATAPLNMVRRWVRERYGLRVESVGDTHAFTHQTTHRTIRFIVHPLRATAGRLRRDAGAWRKLHALDDLPLPNPQRRIVRWLADREHL